MSASPRTAPACEVYERGNPGRPELESFIRTAFERKHGASVHTFMPTLAALRGGRGMLLSVAGWRNARLEPLYLEAYLDRPVEDVLSAQTGHPVPREEIVEVGNLASGGCSAARYLVALLPNLLLERGHRWVVFTATAAVRRIMDSFNAPLLDLGSASAAHVAGRADQWGRYYAADPRVMAGHLPDGARLATMLRLLAGKQTRA